MTVIESLIELQDVDGRIRELEVELKDLPRRKALETARLSGASADLEAAKAARKYELDVMEGYKADEEALREKINNLKIVQAGLKSNKEYAQYSTQIELLDHDLDVATNNFAKVSDNLPEADKRIAEAQAAYDRQKGGVDAFCAEIDERLAAVTAELEECKADREAKARAVPDPKFLLYYERLRTKRWPVVAPLTHDGVCDGCHLVQPPSVGQLVQANARNGREGRPQSIVACTMCGRMLYGDL